jgi:hypothetical protein
MKNGTMVKSLILILGSLAILAVGAYLAVEAVRDAANQTVQPVTAMTGDLATQVSQILHPTPTVLPDPVTIVHDVRSLARLETIQYTVEKVVTADSGQGALKALFGDRLLFVGHGMVIAGIDLEKLAPEDLWAVNGVLYVHLPDPEIFVATLDNEQSYVYDRQTGLFTHGDVNLETAARQVAEDEIRKAALQDGILELARQNAESYLSRLLRSLGFPEVIFAEESGQ